MFAFLLFSTITMSSAWKVLLSHPFYENVKLVTSSATLLVFLSPAGSQFDCALLCLRRSDCQAANWYPGNGSFVCELLKSNVCSDPLRTSIKLQPMGRVWDKVFDYTNTKSCISVIQTNLPVNCTGINSTVCDHCTRTCGDCFQRLKNNSGNTQYPCTLWPQGIVNSSLTTFCMTETPYLIMRKYLDFGVPAMDYYQNMSVTDMHRIVRLGIYETIHFRIVLKNTTQPRGVYRFDGEGIDEQGRLSITFLPSEFPLTSTDILNLKGQPLIKAPFVNTSEVLPSCGPFWLLPQGNSTCPGGSVIRFGTKPEYLDNGTMIDIGVHWPSAGRAIDFNRACISLV